MTQLDFDSDPKLQLLTDALRAGPGTPEWREALASVGGAAGADEYKLLYAARERLASGRQYREVRAGPGFARRLFDAVEREPQGTTRSFPAANLIAAASALVILGVLSIVAWFLIPPSNSTPAEDLSLVYFVNPVAQVNFDSEIPGNWNTFGSLPVESRQGLRPRWSALSPDFRGGGIVWGRSFSPPEPFSVEVSIRPSKTNDYEAVQVFVTDQATFNNGSATTPHELALLIRGGEASLVLPSGRVEGEPIKLRDRAPLDVRLRMKGASADAEVNGKRLWSGDNALDPGKPRWIGIRFLARDGGEEKDRTIVQSVRILTPQSK